MTEPTYILDGIQTAFIWWRHGSEPGCDSTHTTVDCECGWGMTWRHAGHDAQSLDLAALRFHYQNCRLARLPEIEGGEPAARPRKTFMMELGAIEEGR